VTTPCGRVRFRYHLDHDALEEAAFVAESLAQKIPSSKSVVMAAMAAMAVTEMILTFLAMQRLLYLRPLYQQVPIDPFLREAQRMQRLSKATRS
jgi:hypothetical protein